MRLYNEWVKSGFIKEKIPTIDRIDARKGYTLDNIHVLTWAENRYKQRFELKRVIVRNVCQILNGKIINTFRSVKDASIKTGICQSNISTCLNNRRKTAGGCSWIYEKNMPSKVRGNIHDNKELLEDK